MQHSEHAYAKLLCNGLTILDKLEVIMIDASTNEDNMYIISSGSFPSGMFFASWAMERQFQGPTKILCIISPA